MQLEENASLKIRVSSLEAAADGAAVGQDIELLSENQVRMYGHPQLSLLYRITVCLC